MRSIDYRPRKENLKKEETKESTPGPQTTEPEANSTDIFDESVVIN